MTRSPSLSRLVSACVGLSLVALIMPVLPAARADFLPPLAVVKTSEPELLVPAKAVERSLSAGQSHSYLIKLVQGQFVRVLVEQRGVDVSLALSYPAKKLLAQIDHKQTERGIEAASLIADHTGDYLLEVRSLDKGTLSGSYEIKIDQLFTATDREQKLTAANEIVASADLLVATRAKPSINEAVTKFQEALTAFTLAGDLQMKAIVLNKLGRCLFSLGEYRKAIDQHLQALPLARSAGDRQEEAFTLTLLGDAYRLVMETDRSRDSLNQSIQAWQLIQDRRGELRALNLIGRIYYGTGEVHKALLCLDRALDLSKVLSDRDEEMSAVSGVAAAYYLLGEFEKARDNWKESLALARSERSQGMEMVFLSKLGSVHDALGEKQEALTYLDQSIQLARARGSRTDEAGALQTKGRVYRSIGEYQKAIEHLDQSLALLQGINNPSSVARAHYNLGKVYTDLGQFEKAVNYLNQALPVWKTRNDPINIAATIRELARAERGRGDLETALAQSDAAISVMEAVRAGAGEPELRASYLAIVQDCFELKVDVLGRLHKLYPSKNYAALALQTSESARARSLLDSLAEVGIDVREGVPRDLLNREQTITEKLRDKASERARLVGAKARGESLRGVNRDISELSSQYERIAAEIRAASPRAELLQPKPLSLAEIREQVLDNQTVLLEYYLGQERSYLFAVTSTSIDSYELPKRSVIDTAARQVYELLTARNRRVKFETSQERQARVAKADADYPAAALTLSRVVLGPVAGQLANKRLLIVGDGALQYVPFGALPSPNRNGEAGFEPLTLTNEVVSLPSASTLGLLRREIAKRERAPKTIAVLADPVFEGNDARVKESIARGSTVPAVINSKWQASMATVAMQRSASESGWDGEGLSMSRLPFTRKEADAIISLVPPAARKEQLDFAASLANATSPELSQYQIVHFATHGFLNSRHPELSGIVLSLVNEKGREQDGFLRAQEIYNLKLPAELVVLSGCRTGLGKEIRGEGLVGLTRAFMHAGAARVMVSLWDVHDEGTAELMKHFYGGLLGRERQSASAAMRAAQISMLRDKRWSAPYYWAAFTLQGEPR